MSLENQAQVVSNQEILNAIQHLQHKVDVTSKRQRLSETAVSFKSEGNKDQHTHSAKIATLLDSALGSLELGDITSTKSTLQETLEAVKQRQKLIKLADRSPLGWATIKEYLTDNLADDSDDEKRLRKAEKSAVSKRVDAAKKTKSNSKFSTNRYSLSTAPPVHQSSFRRFPYNFTTPSFGVDRRMCFQCGITGHVRTNCPSLRALRASQQQPAATTARISPT